MRRVESENAPMAETTRDFWDQRFATEREPLAVRRSKEAVVERACAWLGDVRGKTILDLGCGNGASSLMLAEKGARVIAVDTSEEGIAILRRECERRRLTNVRAEVGDALDIERFGPLDGVIGLMILHHIEPFDRFVDELQRSLRPGGRAFFWENNALPLLMWFRTHLVGRLWVPKHGDPEETPLSPTEVDTMRRGFAVKVAYPDLFLFRLISIYLLRNGLRSWFDAMDRFAYNIAFLRSLSYKQEIMLERC